MNERNEVWRKKNKELLNCLKVGIAVDHLCIQVGKSLLEPLRTLVYVREYEKYRTPIILNRFLRW